MSVVGRVIRDHTSWVDTVAVTPDGRHSYSGGGDNTLRKHDLRSGTEVCSKQNAHSDLVSQARCAPNGEFVVTCDNWNDKLPKVWNTENLDLLQQLEGHEDAVRCVGISPTSRRSHLVIRVGT